MPREEEGRAASGGRCLHMAQGHEVPRREVGGTPKGEGRSSSSKRLASQFPKCPASLYLLEEACPHIVGLGKVNTLAQKLLKL